MSNISIAYLREKLCFIPDREEVVTVPEEEWRKEKETLFKSLDWKERARVNLGLRTAPEPPRTITKKIPGVYKRIYIIEEKADGIFASSKYYEPFTKTEFFSREIKIQNWKNKGLTNYLIMPDVDPRVWAIEPFVSSWDGDGNYYTEWGDYEGYVVPNTPEFDEFKALKNDEKYQKKLREYFEELHRRSKHLPPSEPSPETQIKDFLSSL